ncbi:factor Xa inhibitor BuXI [Beta vulgaris subsp. vulgaris]|uniref:factor Xa inhibitor BuXI n=1 Tax=Beta vulgaris subsp. vulgaris TaxID=3555 RepID=UPI0020366DB8|nr:factor Xa inhibitor BuXI [Beta vulgaris subsp. vulgaris]
MASIFLKSTTTLILIFSAFCIATAIILDTDGDALRNGGQYYILPQSIGFGGGLTLKSKSGYSPCPLYITRENDETSPGIPVTIASPARIAIITSSLPISIVFNDIPNICMQPLGWQVIPDGTTGQSYVATGGSGIPFNPTETFSIEQIGDNNVYKISNKAGSGEARDVGFFEKDGLLGITNDIPLPIVFRKAFDVLSMV